MAIWKTWKCSFYMLVLQRIMDVILMSTTKLMDASAQAPLKIRPFKFPETVKEGKNVQVVCGLEEGEMDVEFKWIKDGLPIVSDSYSTIVTKPKYSVLEVNNVKVINSGNYTCIVKNEEGMDRYTSALVVQGPPTWKKEPVDVEVTFGESVEIHCSAYGSPAPSVVWTKENGGKSDGSFGDLQEFVDEEGTLSLVNVQHNNKGYYTCTVENGFGNSLQKRIEIKIKGKHVKGLFNNLDVE